MIGSMVLVSPILINEVFLGLMEKEKVVHQKVSSTKHGFFEVRITQVTVNELLLLGTVLCHEMGRGHSRLKLQKNVG